MPFRIAPIVEGHGEVRAVPELLRRIIAELNPRASLEVCRPIRQARGTLLKAGGLERAVGLATIEIQEQGAVLILLVSEGSCPAELAAELLARAVQSRPDKNISIVLAHQEFEAWFLAAASSLRGRCGLNEAIEDHDFPETVADCKGWLARWKPAAFKYSETVDQVALAATFDLELAKRARSFRKLYGEMERICHLAEASVAT